MARLNDFHLWFLKNEASRGTREAVTRLAQETRWYVTHGRPIPKLLAEWLEQGLGALEQGESADRALGFIRASHCPEDGALAERNARITARLLDLRAEGVNPTLTAGFSIVAGEEGISEEQVRNVWRSSGHGQRGKPDDDGIRKVLIHVPAIDD